MVVPTPTATPLTAATIGLLQRTSAGRKRSAGRLRPFLFSAALRKSTRSLPAENAPGTPAISMQRTESSAFAPSSAAVIVSYMASVSAFFLLGRFIRMVRMPSASVTITCSVINSDLYSTATGSARSITVVVSRCRVGQMGGKEARGRTAAVSPQPYHGCAFLGFDRLSALQRNAVVGGLITKTSESRFRAPGTTNSGRVEDARAAQSRQYRESRLLLKPPALPEDIYLGCSLFASGAPDVGAVCPRQLAVQSASAARQPFEYTACGNVIVLV